MVPLIKEGKAEQKGCSDTTLPVLIFKEYNKFKEVKKKRGWSDSKEKYSANFDRTKRKSSW